MNHTNSANWLKLTSERIGPPASNNVRRIAGNTEILRETANLFAIPSCVAFAQPPYPLGGYRSCNILVHLDKDELSVPFVLGILRITAWAVVPLPAKESRTIETRRRAVIDLLAE